MYLEKLSLLNFKNIHQAELSLCSSLNCFVGDNGAGKTNVMDAVYFLSLCKSAFGVSDAGCVTHGTDFFMVDGRYTISDSRRETVVCSYKRAAGKVVKRSGKEYEKLSEHIGLLPVVLISPADTVLINDSGDDRRRYLNAFLSQLDREYLDALVKYNSTLSQRNRILKNPYGFEDVMEVMDVQLVRYGSVIYERRRDLIAELMPRVAEYYAILSEDRESVELTYKSDLADTPFEQLLRDALTKDRIVQHTTVGIHRDDMSMKIMGYPIRRYGSQGQQKTFLVALKLAQYDILRNRMGVKPLLLLDDVFDKLDMHRVEQLISLVSRDTFGQIFITDSNKVRLETILNKIDGHYTLFEVSGGEINDTTQPCDEPNP